MQSNCVTPSHQRKMCSTCFILPYLFSAVLNVSFLKTTNKSVTCSHTHVSVFVLQSQPCLKPPFSIKCLKHLWSDQQMGNNAMTTFLFCFCFSQSLMSKRDITLFLNKLFFCDKRLWLLFYDCLTSQQHSGVWCGGRNHWFYSFLTDFKLMSSETKWKSLRHWESKNSAVQWPCLGSADRKVFGLCW